MMARLVACLAASALTQFAQAALVTDPDDARSWQGANVGTFAALYYGANTLANRQLVVDNKLLDDSIFDATGYVASTLITSVGEFSGQGGRHLDRHHGHGRLCLHMLWRCGDALCGRERDR